MFLFFFFGCFSVCLFVSLFCCCFVFWLVSSCGWSGAHSVCSAEPHQLCLHGTERIILASQGDPTGRYAWDSAGLCRHTCWGPESNRILLFQCLTEVTMLHLGADYGKLQGVGYLCECVVSSSRLHYSHKDMARRVLTDPNHCSPVLGIFSVWGFTWNLKKKRGWNRGYLYDRKEQRLMTCKKEQFQGFKFLSYGLFWT